MISIFAADLGHIPFMAGMLFLVFGLELLLISRNPIDQFPGTMWIEKPGILTDMPV